MKRKIVVLLLPALAFSFAVSSLAFAQSSPEGPGSPGQTQPNTPQPGTAGPPDSEQNEFRFSESERSGKKQSPTRQEYTRGDARTYPEHAWRSATGNPGQL
jgi:hypothetical protein